jgi:hypothetical protein
MRGLPAVAIPEREAVANGDANNATNDGRKGQEARFVTLLETRLCRNDSEENKGHPMCQTPLRGKETRVHSSTYL